MMQEAEMVVQVELVELAEKAEMVDITTPKKAKRQTLIRMQMAEMPMAVTAVTPMADSRSSSDRQIQHWTKSSFHLFFTRLPCQGCLTGKVPGGSFYI